MHTSVWCSRVHIVSNGEGGTGGEGEYANAFVREVKISVCVAMWQAFAVKARGEGE